MQTNPNVGPATTDATAAAPAPTRKARTILSIGAGNAVEWYDWAIYATFAPFFATQIFDNTNPASAVLATLAIFAVGFLARPLGGFFFGALADRVGRKASMTTAVGLAAFGSLVIALTPTFANAGVFASLMLLSARLIQGLAHGGEMPSAQTYISEVAPAARRGLWSTLIYISGTIGNLAGILLGAILALVLTNEQMLAWGWRVPFFIGAALGFYALVMRSKLQESTVFKSAASPAAQKERIWPQIVQHRAKALQIIGLTIGGTVNYYAWGVSAPTYASTQLGMDRGSALWASVGANLVFLAVIPFWGMLSDKVGRKPILLINALGSAALFFPMNWILSSNPWSLFLAQSVMMIVISASCAILPATMAELFPTGIRTVGVAVPYSIAVALFGGTAPYMQSWLAQTFGPNAFSTYAVVLLVITALAVRTIPETKGIDLGAPTPEHH